MQGFTLTCLSVRAECDRTKGSEELRQREGWRCRDLHIHNPLFACTYLLLINRRNGPRYQRVLALCAFLNRGNTEGTNSSKILCLTFVYILLYVNLCQD